MMCDHRRTFVLFLGASITALAFQEIAVAGCRPGTYEYSQQQVDNVIYHYCISAEHRRRLLAIDAELRTLHDLILRDRRSIQAWQADGPHFLNSLDEWTRMDEQAREETRTRARNAIITGVLDSMRIQALQNITVTQEELDAEWQALSASSLRSPEFQDFLHRQRVGAAIIKKWESRDQMIDTFERLQQVLEGMKDVQARKYAETLLLVVKETDPRAAILADDLDFAATALVGNATAWTARGRMQQLLKLGDQRLSAIASLAKTYKMHVDRQTKLTNERKGMLAPMK